MLFDSLLGSCVAIQITSHHYDPMEVPVSENRTTAQLLVEHARLMNQHGPDSAEVTQFVEAYRSDTEFVELSELAATLKRAFQKRNAPLVIEYTNILHAFGGPDSKEAQVYVQQHSDDLVFVRRAKTLNELWKLKGRQTE